MKAPKLSSPEVLTPAEVAALFRVGSKTVGAWAKAGRIPCFRTLGGHSRFRRADVEAALRGEWGDAQ
ncbi:BldC family transcriptional regulator [Streptosporangium sp. NPDC003464]